MATKATITEFLSQKKLAIVGISRTGKKFSNAVYKELKLKGYRLFPVNPQAENILGESCYPNLRSLPEKVEGVVIITKPAISAGIIREVHEAGIKHVWLQQGTESKEAIDFCNSKQMNVIHGECILMFAEPIGSFHKFHRWIWKLIGKLPK